MNSFKITGLDCANCARELEEEILKLDGVKEATVDFMAQKVYALCDGATLGKVKEVCNNFEEVKVVEEPAASQVFAGEKLNIAGLCCANCARELEEDLNRIEGVSAVVDFVNLRVLLNVADPSAREKAIYTITHFEDVKIVNEKPERKSVVKERLKDIILIAVATALFIPALVLDLTGTAKSGLPAEIITYVLYGLSYLTVGHPVLINTVKNIAKGKIFDENFLMAIASIGAILLGIFAGDGFYISLASFCKA